MQYVLIALMTVGFIADIYVLLFFNSIRYLYERFIKSQILGGHFVFGIYSNVLFFWDMGLQTNPPLNELQSKQRTIDVW